MIYHPEEREEILAKRAERELRERTYYPKPTPEECTDTLSEKSGSPTPTPLDRRLEEYRKMKKEKRSKRTFIDEFLDSEENQKKYGFTTRIVNGIREIYYDGDLDVLNDAIYGPRTVSQEPDDSAKMIRLSEDEGQLYARLPHASDEIPVDIRMGCEGSTVPSFAIVAENGAVLTQLCLTDPAYYPDEQTCRYLIDMRGLSVLNGYVRNNFHRLIDEWNRLHPTQALDDDIPLPNYRFLASYAYSKMKREKPGQS